MGNSAVPRRTPSSAAAIAAARSPPNPKLAASCPVAITSRWSAPAHRRTDSATRRRRVQPASRASAVWSSRHRRRLADMPASTAARSSAWVFAFPWQQRECRRAGRHASPHRRVRVSSSTARRSIAWPVNAFHRVGHAGERAGARASVRRASWTVVHDERGVEPISKFACAEASADPPRRTWARPRITSHRRAVGRETPSSPSCARQFDGLAQPQARLRQRRVGRLAAFGVDRWSRRTSCATPCATVRRRELRRASAARRRERQLHLGLVR